ncbi:M23 family metallopeptidase [Qipengyuania sp. JC766]|uniref:M23 family metallopeptidase n=1 Tax=Qipengyuania sp. JC766 TaxID=3232139 RepID=UPI00345A81DC
MGTADRLLTIVLTAGVTSAAWFLATGGLLDLSSSEGAEDAAPEAPVASSASPAAEEISASASVDGPARPAGGLLLVPVAGVARDSLSDSFEDARGDGHRTHQAIDIMAEAGTPVVAAAPGTVEQIFLSDDGGRTIYVRSPDRRTIHYYAHLQSYAPGLAEGDRVAEGERLGTVGSTGNAAPEAPHLHFAIKRVSPQADWYDEGRVVNPYPLLTGETAPNP